MRADLVLIDPVGLSGRQLWLYHWLWARAHLAERDVVAAAEVAHRMLQDPEIAELSPGGAWAVLALDHHRRGDDVQARSALNEARRTLTGSVGEELASWVEHVLDGGSWTPLPRFESRATLGDRLHRSGRWFQVAGERVELTGSPVSVALARALAQGLKTRDELIEAAWPGDASGYLSLKNRLHSALRALRKKGLDDHLQLDDGRYALVGLIVDDSDDA